MLYLPVADLEQLAIKRDRGYLVRLILSLALGVAASVFIWRGLTGHGTTSCVANAFLGQQQQPQTGNTAATPKP
ncbi:MAG: hypothetical protein ACHQ53_05440 [Polyangiales bacterium]